MIPRKTFWLPGLLVIPLFALSLLLIPEAQAQTEAIIYPNKGQSQQQQEQDQFQCYN